MVSIAARDGYDVLQSIAAVSVAAMALGVLVMVAFTLLQMRKIALSLARVRRGFSADPGVEAMRRAANHVESISRTLNQETEKLSGSISRLSDRLTQASDRMEERIEDFNALMEVVQGEAEGAFVDGAATARGVRRGLGDLTSRAFEPTRRRRRTGDGAARRTSHELPPADSDDEEIETEGLGPAGGTASGR